MKSRCGSVRWKLGVVLVFSALLLLASCATTKDWVTGKSTYNRFSRGDELRLGEAAYRHNLTRLDEEGVALDADEERVNQLHTMMLRISAVADDPELPYEMTLVHNGVVNACCYPAGLIMVFSGLYDPDEDFVNDEDELAAIMAHEIAHANCRHTTEQISQEEAVESLIGLVSTAASLGGEQEFAEQLQGVFTRASGLLIPLYDRTQEYEADRVGLMYMAQAGYDPRAAPRIWKRAADKAGIMEVANMVGSIYSTHPAGWNRYQALQRHLAAATGVYRDLQDANFSGTWQTTFGKMTLKQSGRYIKGRYTSKQGKIAGSIRGNILVGNWSEAPTRAAPDDLGDVVLRLSDDGDSFTGRWRFGSTGDWDGTWEGTRE